MNVLISAYACEPDKGSEPGLGWEWICQLASNHTLWVVTRANNRSAIERSLHKLPRPVHFIYIDIPKALSFWKRGHRGVNLYYFLWQIAAWLRCRNLIAKHQIDLAHHVTLMSVSRYTFVPSLGIPSIVGPVGGLQLCPSNLREVLCHPFREWIRDWSVKLLRYNPFFLFGAARATQLILATSSGLEFLPRKLKNSIRIFQIASKVSPGLPIEGIVRDKKFHILWSSRLEDHKGLEILIRTVDYIKKTLPSIFVDMQITITGNGAEKIRFQNLTEELEISDKFHFSKWLIREDYEKLWKQVDIFIFTSLRETTGVALLEAMHYGKACIVVKNGGPGEIITPETGILIEPENLDIMIKNFAMAIQKLYCDPELREKIGEAAMRRAQSEYSWEAVVEKIERIYHEAIDRAE